MSIKFTDGSGRAMSVTPNTGDRMRRDGTIYNLVRVIADRLYGGVIPPPLSDKQVNNSKYIPELDVITDEDGYPHDLYALLVGGNGEQGTASGVEVVEIDHEPTPEEESAMRAAGIKIIIRTDLE